MANEGNFGEATGQTLVVILLNISNAGVKTYWNGTSMQSSYASAVANGKLTCDEADGNTIYDFTMPAVAADYYIILVLDTDDTVNHSYTQYWDGTSLLENNIDAISGDSTAADNLEAQYDTTGLTGDNFPSKQSQIASVTTLTNLVVSGADISIT